MITTEDLARRAEMPQMLRDMVALGYSSMTLEITSRTALRLADDIEYAVLRCPDGTPDQASEVYSFISLRETSNG